MDNKILQTIIKENILSDEFLNYFNSTKYVQEEKILNKFLDQMINITEALLDYGIDEIKPATLLKNLINKFS
jgi:stalled ribosome rescue protein Dom34